MIRIGLIEKCPVEVGENYDPAECSGRIIDASSRSGHIDTIILHVYIMLPPGNRGKPPEGCSNFAETKKPIPGSILMSDFYQTGAVATLHKLGKNNLEELESRLARYAQDRPIALVLPSLYSEINGAALQTIVNELKKVEYIKEIVVTLGPASETEFETARQFFSVLPQKTSVIWNTGKRLKKLYRAIEGEDLPTGFEGKGRSVWMAYGYVLARHEFNAIALHDCDIVTYSRDMLARLCYPVTNPSLDYDFCKGYYARVTDKLHGRVTRLFVTPLIRALENMIGYHPLLVFFDSFRYILAGEFSMDVNLARINKIPGDWGLEVGTLAEVYKNTSINRVCQVDISENYEHKHQDLSPEDASKGLNKMCVDICQVNIPDPCLRRNCLFRRLLQNTLRHIFAHGPGCPEAL